MIYGAEADIGGMFREVVQPNAFELRDVILNFFHDRTQPLARGDGGGLELRDDAKELYLSAEIPAHRADLVDLVKRRILRGFSVEMEVTSEEWPTPDKRIIMGAVLHGIALVDKPAYSAATAAIAKRQREFGAARSWPYLVV